MSNMEKLCTAMPRTSILLLPGRATSIYPEARYK